jgi:hypothetical protein
LPAPGRLLLERAERIELAVGVGHRLDRGRPERADQLALEIRLAGEEAALLEIVAEGADELALLACVVEARQRAQRPKLSEEVPDRVRTADRDDLDARGHEVDVAPLGERLHRDLVARALDEHDRPRELSQRRARQARPWRRASVLA